MCKHMLIVSVCMKGPEYLPALFNQLALLGNIKVVEETRYGVHLCESATRENQ